MIIISFTVMIVLALIRIQELKNKIKTLKRYECENKHLQEVLARYGDTGYFF